jgi:hypothetical protein
MSLRPLRSAVESWAPGRGIAADPLHRIAAAWPEIVGRDVAAHSEPIELSGTTLVVATRSSAWSQQLQFLSPEILRAVRALAHGAEVKRLAFRWGGLRRAFRRSAAARVVGAEGGGGSSGRRERGNDPPSEPAADASEALARLRARIAATPRAGGSCAACGARLDAARDAGCCAPCDGARERARQTEIQRLVYMAPWLTLADLREQLPDLSGSEFERARRLLLQRWWLMLDRARRAGTLSPSGIERHVASSYVLLQSRLPPDRITPAVVANLLGEDTAKLIWPGDGPPAKPPRPGRSGPFVE